MYTTTTIIHYNRHLVLRQEFGKYKWRGKEFDTEEQAFKAIDDKITHFKNKNMEQNKFEWTDELVGEFASKMLMDLYTNNDNINKPQNHIANFKASKTKPKEYEILEFSVDYLGESNIVFYKLTEPNVYRKKGTDFPIWFDILNTQKEKSFKIKRVRRLSDGEVFSIGDEILHYGVNYKIENIGISNGVVKINGCIFTPIAELQKAKQPILTTHDGKDIYKLDKCWYVGKEFEINEWVAFETEILHLDKLKYFSTKEAAESYIAWNKTQFSLAEIMANSHLLQEDGSMDCYAFSRIKLIELAKSKTK